MSTGYVVTYNKLSHDGFIPLKDILSKYKDSCTERSVSPMANRALLGVSQTENSRRIINGNRENVYMGLSWKNQMEKLHPNLFNKENLLISKYFSWFLKQSATC